MQRLLALAGGLVSGATIGTIVALLFTPRSGDEMRKDLERRKERVKMAGRLAADAKRAELEAELAALTRSPLARETRAPPPATLPR